MKGGIYILSAMITFFIALLLAVLFMLLKYRKKLKDSNYTLVDQQRVNFESCVGGEKKPYIKRLVQYLLGYSDIEVADDGDSTSEVNTGLTKLVPVQPSSESDGEYHGSTSSLAIRPRTQSYQYRNTVPQVST